MSVEIMAVGFAALAGVTLLMAITFFLGRRLNNYGVVDAVWAWSFAAVTLWYVLALEGGVLRQAVLFIMVALWSIRLGTYLAHRIAAAHPHEDWRYHQLRSEWGDRFATRMFGFYLLQGIFVMVLSAPLLLASANPARDFGFWEGAGIVFFVIAICGEALADRQLRRFKRRRLGRDQVCQDGLWRYSRHPNYFFEWLIWVGFAVYALGSPLGWLGLIAPLTMLWLLLKVTGIPPTEQHAVKSKGEAYRAYQRTTSAFFPWFRSDDLR